MGCSWPPWQPPQRLARAWEVLEATGTPLSIWHNAPTQLALAADYLPILLLPAREDLVAACAARFAAMMTAGALAEVAAAIQKGIAHDAPATPTQIPEPKFVSPTLSPDQKIE